MRRQFLALLTGALAVILSVGVGVSVAAGTQSGGKGKADDAGAFVHDLRGAEDAKSSVPFARRP